MRLSDRGAVFVEAMIASAIVAMVLAALFQVMADSAARNRALEQRRMALLVARSELADVGADIPLAAGATSGVAGPFSWRVDITPYTAEGEASAAGALLKTAVSVRQRGGGPELARLISLHLAPEA
jgi:type II secretory pathway component PulJ